MLSKVKILNSWHRNPAFLNFANRIIKNYLCVGVFNKIIVWTLALNGSTMRLSWNNLKDKIRKWNLDVPNIKLTKFWNGERSWTAQVKRNYERTFQFSERSICSMFEFTKCAIFDTLLSFTVIKRPILEIGLISNVR